VYRKVLFPIGMFAPFYYGIPSVFKGFGKEVVVALRKVHPSIAGFMGKEPITKDERWDG
jgi:hypothetical protein